MSKPSLYNTIIQAVPIKKKGIIDMDDGLCGQIELWAKECYTKPELKLRDEIVKKIYLKKRTTQIT
jgi:hypothetical protein